MIVARNEWKHVADVVMDLEVGLPAVVCYLADINQAVMNLLINAIHAIQESQTTRNDTHKGTVTITTSHEDNVARIIVKDSGAGIPVPIRHKIFDPFFTTKKVGKGPGQGLSISYQSIVKKHHGKLWLESEVGKGTVFFIELPVDGESSPA